MVTPKDNDDLKQTLTNSHYWLALSLVPRMRISKKIALVERVGLKVLFSPKAPLLENSLTSPQQAAIASPDWPKINKIIDNSNACNSEIISYNDSAYPKLLQQIYDPPLVLFARGNVNLLNQRQMALVGSRNATAMGREIAKQLASELAARQLVITSGLALGIDAQAHLGALACNGGTIAVVATGLDQVYPARHKNLQKEILANSGLIISEFPPGTLPKPGHFPKRNRLISGLSLGVVVVEASLKSGSLITARCALEQGREVFAIPSSIFNEQAKGCHWLIKQGAKLVEDCADIIEELDEVEQIGLNLPISKGKDGSLEKSDKQDLFNDPMLASVGYEITPVDLVVSRSKLPIDVVLTRLTMLELRGLVSAVPGGYLKL